MAVSKSTKRKKSSKFRVGETVEVRRPRDTDWRKGEHVKLTERIKETNVPFEWAAVTVEDGKSKIHFCCDEKDFKKLDTTKQTTKTNKTQNLF